MYLQKNFKVFFWVFVFIMILSVFQWFWNSKWGEWYSEIVPSIRTRRFLISNMVHILGWALEPNLIVKFLMTFISAIIDEHLQLRLVVCQELNVGLGVVKKNWFWSFIKYSYMYKKPSKIFIDNPSNSVDIK